MAANTHPHRARRRPLTARITYRIARATGHPCPWCRGRDHWTRPLSNGNVEIPRTCRGCGTTNAAFTEALAPLEPPSDDWGRFAILTIVTPTTTSYPWGPEEDIPAQDGNTQTTPNVHQPAEPAEPAD